MPLVVKDRVKESSITSGTGTLTLDGAAPGFQTFAAIGNGNTTYYAIIDSIANTWEIGIGTYTLSTTTLSRDTVLANSLGNTTLINFAGNPKDVFCTYPAGRSVYSDGTNIVPASSATVLTTSGGTGLSSYTAGDLPYYATGTALSKLPIGANKTILTSTGSAPQWTASLDPTQGGTGQTTYTDGQLLIGNSTGNTLTKATLTQGSGVTITNGAGSITISATGLGGTVTSVDVSGGLTGLTTSGGPVISSGTITLGGTLAVGYGGTGATTIAGAQTNLQVDPAGTAVAMAIALG
jgi:hypothetical protein